VLGVSECSDLAVIDIEGDGYPFLNWFNGEIKPGIDVFAAGYPLDDPEFTLTKGIVSKAKADDISPSSNIDHVIEHDANIQPGNSGGPLITEDAQVVGVNYAGFDFAGAGTEQFFAIASDTAQPIVDQLQQGENVDSLGINGTAVTDDESGTFGVWVNAVDAGSPASSLGLQPGDIITQMAGKDVASDGTMKDYCDVLRTKGQDAAIGVEVLRFDTSEVLRGEFNGKELVQAFSFADELGTSDDAATETYDSFSIVTDDSNTIQVEVPDEWSDVRGGAQDIAGVQAPSIQASPNVDDFLNTFDVPGMEFVLSDQFTPDDFETILDAVGPSEFCTSDGREDYSDPIFTGRFEVWTDCQGTDAQYIVVVASEAESTEVAIVTVQAIDDRDFDALDHILDTFSTTTTDLGGD
jgi:serine protease Do